ncbi:MAG: ribonuclease D [Rickettsiales bacterium]|jgi:ribonuclease D|nr:ribonuclease D [Rickettsiales bacterium]
MKNKIIYLEGDIAKESIRGDSIAIDAEMTGLSLMRDRLCTVQIATDGGPAFVIKLDPPYDCPNLKRILNDRRIVKIGHFIRADMAMIQKCLGIEIENVFCTKIASRLCRTSSDKHSLGALVREICGVELDKDEQTSDWAGPLSQRQIEYAAADVIHLHRIRDELARRLEREGRTELARKCFDFLPARVRLDLGGFGECDIFAH